MTVTLGCIGDLHGRLDRLERIAAWLRERDPDAVLLTGDFGHASRRDRPACQGAVAILEPLDVPILLVPGNHDRPELGHPASVDRRAREVAGVRIWGLGGSPRTPARLPYEWTDDGLAGLEAPSCDVVLSHAPPRDTALDRMHDGRHVGSRTVRAIAEARPEAALVCGHIHEAAGAEVVGGCLCYNAGSLGAFAGRVQVGLLQRGAAGGGWEVEHHHLAAGTSWRVSTGG